MGDQSRMLTYLLLSNIALWILVMGLLIMKLSEFLKKRAQMKAVVYDNTGNVKAEYVLGKQREILIGKSTPVTMVNIDFSDSEYAKTIEELHASFWRSGTFWYVKSYAGNGMVGLKQKGGNTVYKLRKDIPYRIGIGDIIYISYEKIVIQ